MSMSPDDESTPAPIFCIVKVRPSIVVFTPSPFSTFGSSLSPCLGDVRGEEGSAECWDGSRWVPQSEWDLPVNIQLPPDEEE